MDKKVFLLIAAALIKTSNANAALETWELTATITSQSVKTAGYEFPTFLSVGSTITVDYVFDDQAPTQLTCCSSPDPVRSVTFNGETSFLGQTQSSDGVIDSGTLNAINVGFSGRQKDSVTFISFNDSFSVVEPSMPQLLQSFHNDLNTYYSAANVSRITYRIDLNNNAASAYAKVTSFNEVPLPNTLYLFGSGIAGICLNKYRRRQSQYLSPQG